MAYVNRILSSLFFFFIETFSGDLWLSMWALIRAALWDLRGPVWAEFSFIGVPISFWIKGGAIFYFYFLRPPQSQTGPDNPIVWKCRLFIGASAAHPLKYRPNCFTPSFPYLYLLYRGSLPLLWGRLGETIFFNFLAFIPSRGNKTVMFRLNLYGGVSATGWFKTCPMN